MAAGAAPPGAPSTGTGVPAGGTPFVGGTPFTGGAPFTGGTPFAPGTPVAGAVSGLGATEAVRRELSPSDLAVLLATQVEERRAAADEVERHGRDADAARLRREADIVAAYRDRA